MTNSLICVLQQAYLLDSNGITASIVKFTDHFIVSDTEVVYQNNIPKLVKFTRTDTAIQYAVKYEDMDKAFVERTTENESLLIEVESKRKLLKLHELDLMKKHGQRTHQHPSFIDLQQELEKLENKVVYFIP